MKLIVRDQNSKLVGVVGFSVHFTFSADTDPKFKALAKKLEKDGIPVIVRKTEDNNTAVYVQELVKGKTPQALFALRDYLISDGYKVDDYHEETVAELTKLLEEYDDGEEKKALLKKIPSLSYLEQTALLEELKSMPPQ